MRTLRAWLLRLSGVFRKDRREHELAAEMESHLQLHIEDNLRAAMNSEEARRRALIKLGGLDKPKKTTAIAAVFRFWKHYSRICGSPSACSANLPALRSSLFSLWPWASGRRRPSSVSRNQSSGSLFLSMIPAVWLQFGPIVCAILRRIMRFQDPISWIGRRTIMPSPKWQRTIGGRTARLRAERKRCAFLCSRSPQISFRRWVLQTFAGGIFCRENLRPVEIMSPS
jgi:hypothetical protein